MVRIVNHQQMPDWFSPWDLLPAQQVSGSGFVIEGGLVLTNAHVVSDTRLLLIFLQGDPRPHQAEVHAMGHDCDLALLRPLDPAALAGRPALQLTGLPALRSTVETVGYPVGGKQISSTRGVVSRIEAQHYSHPGNERHLAVQTDAAINPGNSGGPVLQDGRVVGVAFQAVTGLQNVGYFIPTEVVRHFLVDAATPPYTGFPTLGVRLQNLENPAARAFGALGAEESGAVVDMVFPDSSAEGRLRPGDVVVTLDGQPVANDASVELPPEVDGPRGLRVDLQVLVDRHQVGGVLEVEIVREGARHGLSIPLSGWAPNDRFANRYDCRPRYFVYGGLVFLPLHREMLKTFGGKWQRTADKELLDEYLLRPYREPDQWAMERVVMMRRLVHRVNSGLANDRNVAVEKVNGRRITSLVELIAAFEELPAHEAFHVVEFSNSRLGVLRRHACDAAHEEILAQYGVTRDRNL